MKENFESINRAINPEEYLNSVVDDLIKQTNLDKTTLENISVIQFAPCGFFEGENIRGIVKNFLESKLPIDERMLIIFLNGKEIDDDTVSPIIDSYKEENSKENIVLLKHVWRNDAPISLGMIRAIPVEFIKRVLFAKNIQTNPLMISNDADSVHFSENYLENLKRDISNDQFGGSISRFELSGVNFLYDINIVLGEIDRSIRSFGLEKEEDSFKRNYIYPGGSNTAFRLENYPGYNLTKNKGEDTDLCIKLEDAGVQFKYLNNSKVFTNPRRIINSFNNKKFFHESWKSWENTGDTGRGNNVLEERTFSVEEVVNYLNQYFSNRLYYLYNKDYHKNDIVTFAKYSNNYVRKVIKYLRVFLHSAGIDSYEYSVNEINFQNTEEPDAMNFLHNHKFIEIKNYKHIN